MRPGQRFRILTRYKKETANSQPGKDNNTSPQQPQHPERDWDPQPWVTDQVQEVEHTNNSLLAMVQQLVNLRKSIETSGGLNSPRSRSPAASVPFGSNRASQAPSPTAAAAADEDRDLRAQVKEREKQLSRALLNVQQLSNLIKARDRRITALQMQLAAATAASAMATAALNGDIPPGLSPRASRTPSPSTLTEATAATEVQRALQHQDQQQQQHEKQQQEEELLLRLHDVEAMLQLSESQHVQAVKAHALQLGDVQAQRDLLQQQVVARQHETKELQSQVSKAAAKGSIVQH